MGYTHYWGVNQQSEWSKIWAQLIRDANLIIKTLEDSAPLLGEKDNYHLPTTQRGIRINGQDSHEDFILTEHQSRGFNFCKTAQKDYDIVVTTILMRARMLAGYAFFMSSDGNWDNEWQDALEVYVKLWPEEERPTDDVLMEC